MARTRRRYQAPIPLRRTPRVQLSLSVGMLILLGMLIYQTRQAANWRWIEDVDKGRFLVAGDAPKPGDPPRPTVVLPSYQPEKGPIDSDAKEWADAEEDFGVVGDRTLGDNIRENAALARLHHWVRRQTPENLAARERPVVRLTDLMEAPHKQRGKLVRFTLFVRQAVPIDDPDVEDPLLRKQYLLAGFAKETGTWTYLVQTTALPAGFPTGQTIAPEKVTFDGYFYKIRVYKDRQEKAWNAPLLIGNITWYPDKPQLKQDEGPLFWTGLAIGLPALALLIAYQFYFRPRREAAKLSDVVEPAWIANPDAIPVPPEPVDDDQDSGDDREWLRRN
ncbi:MAG TPA: hypothetical protein VNC50_09650 [Planctomycetia bacterium]|nr:hypothetical protein [Planctomycetia bacterium]